MKYSVRRRFVGVAKTMAAPKLEILPKAQRTIWLELRETLPELVLYGGTALALRLVHRTTEDFVLEQAILAASSAHNHQIFGTCGNSTGDQKYVNSDRRS